jgi:hypothetical protein
MKRFPTAPHWLRAVTTAQRVYGAKGYAWRRGLERHLGIQRGGLRAAVDRPLDDVALRDLDDSLVAFLHHHAGIAYARCLRLVDARKRIKAARDDRETARILALPAGDGDFEWEDMFPEHFSTLRAMQREAV